MHLWRKNLLERQRYPQETGGKALDHRPYDVTGWTLPLQMGVEVTPVLSPVTEAQRSVLTPITKAEFRSKEAGSGSAFLLDPCENAAFQAINQVLRSGGSLAFLSGKAKDCGASASHFVVTGMDRARLLQIAAVTHASFSGIQRSPESTPVRKARVGLYRPWV